MEYGGMETFGSEKEILDGYPEHHKYRDINYLWHQGTSKKKSKDDRKGLQKKKKQKKVQVISNNVPVFSKVIWKNNITLRNVSSCGRIRDKTRSQW